MKVYTASEVFRTANAYVNQNSSTLNYSFGTGLPHGINQVCQCCKESKNVAQIRDVIDLRPWTDFYTSGKYTWAAYECNSCGYKWSWYKPATQSTKTLSE